jgi:hypothetical protein
MDVNVIGVKDDAMHSPRTIVRHERFDTHLSPLVVEFAVCSQLSLL